jgi:peptidoglycan/LPS O-acetylase OafA/YrhL
MSLPERTPPDSNVSPVNPQAAPQTKLLAVDVLRGLAALGVAWFHSRVDLWVGFRAIQASPETYTPLDRFLSLFSLPVSQLGGLVMLFFVLSGFCIHLPNATTNHPASLHLGVYGVRRFFRIVPAYLLTLLLCLLAAVLLWAARSGAMPDWRVYGASALMLQNWLLGGTQIDLNPSLWSIPVEVEFYLVYPLLLWLRRRHGLMAAAALTLLFTAIGCGLFATGSPWAGSTFFGYALIWNAGAWLAEAFVQGRLPHWNGWTTFALFSTLSLTLVGGLLEANEFWLHYGWGVVSFLLLLWMLGAGRSHFLPERTWLKPWVFIGTVSYSLYLLHFPLFKLAGAAWMALYGSKPHSFLVSTIATVLVIPMSWIFYRWIEFPTHQIARHLGRTLQPPQAKLPSPLQRE